MSFDSEEDTVSFVLRWPITPVFFNSFPINMKPIVFKYPDDPELRIPEHILQSKTPEACTSVEIDLKKLNDVWKKDIFSYSGVGGPDRKEARIKTMQKEIASGSTYMPIICLTHKSPEGLMFEDGRHRTAVLIEAGYKTARFVVPSHQANYIKTIFGTSG